MSQILSNQLFEQIDFSDKALISAEYEDCRFISCNFSNVSLAGIIFTDCEFDTCNLSMTNINHTALRNIQFRNSKLLGLRFDECNPFLFSVAFDNCILNLSSFYKQKMKQSKFKDCSMVEVDFSEADLSAAIFDNCDLSGAIFDRTILEKADLRAAYHYTINPEKNRIKKARFSADGLQGLLGSYGIIIE